MLNTPTARRPLYASVAKFIIVVAMVLSLTVGAANATTASPPDSFSVNVLTYAHTASWYLFIVAVVGLVVRRLFEEVVRVWIMVVPPSVTRLLATAAQALLVAGAAAWRSWTERRRPRS